MNVSVLDGIGSAAVQWPTMSIMGGKATSVRRGAKKGAAVRHVFAKRPDYCVSFRPGVIVVRCHRCGQPHEEFFGDTTRDLRDAEIAMLREALNRASAIIEQLGAGRKAAVRAGRRRVHLHT